jgi:hypothetical protein
MKLTAALDRLIERILDKLAPWAPEDPRPGIGFPGWKLRCMWHSLVACDCGHPVTIWWLCRPNGEPHAILTQHDCARHRRERLYPSREWYHPLTN